jgi:peptidoglycan-N-acetylglucosamine deacetylase
MALPFRTPFFLPMLYPDLIWRMKSEENNTKELYLTFDDGPIPEITEWVLTILKEYNTAATFFVIGDNVRKHPTVFREIVNNNHSVGNHTFHHVKGWQTSAENYVNEIMLCDNEMSHASPSFQSIFFRPPYGRITKAQRSKLKDRKIIMWDVLTQDYNRNLSEQKCLAGTTKALRPGSIIVMHDSVKAERNLKFVLPRLLDFALNQNYTFKKL